MDMRAGLLDFRVWWLPTWLYEALPFIYMLGGMIAAAAFDDTTGQLSGLLFCIAGAAIMFIRWKHRNAKVPNRTGPTRVVASQASARSYYNDPWA